MSRPSKLDIHTSTANIPVTESLVIRDDKLMHRFSALLEAIQTQEELRKSGQFPNHAKPEVDQIERRHFESLIGSHLPEDKYHISRPLASGGMGHLYLVHDRDFKRTTVMKFLIPELKNDNTIVKNFIREAQVTAQLEHPNIVPVHDVGYMPEHGIYFTMKYIQGESLADILERLEEDHPDYTARYDYVALLTVFRRVCDAVAFAHAQGHLHRDIKPHNIMVGEYGEVLLMDWGLSRKFRSRHASQKVDFADMVHHRPGEGRGKIIKGTPGYMSPEQAAGLNAQMDVRSDVFLLGATLYHIFTFFPPYLGTTVSEVLQNARTCDYLRPEQLQFGDMDIPTEVCRIMARAMAPRAHDRYQSVDDLTEDLDALLHGRMHTVRRSFESGEHLIREGEIGTECYIITQGTVEIYKSDGNGKVFLGRQSKGDIVGEMALITHEPRSASVIALDDVEVLVLNDKLFDVNIQRLPPWMSKTMQTLAHRLSRTDSMVAEQHFRLHAIALEDADDDSLDATN